MGDVSAFTAEQELILSPYQSFSVRGVRWDGDCGRWILSVSEEERNMPTLHPWIAVWRFHVSGTTAMA
jgi:hypothetical protein